MVHPIRDLEDYRNRELFALRKVARLAGAFLAEPTDPAVREALPLLREALAAHHELKTQALSQGFQ